MFTFLFTEILLMGSAMWFIYFCHKKDVEMSMYCIKKLKDIEDELKKIRGR